jgi:hypothetical protein
MLIFGSVISGIRMSLSACAAGHGERQAVSTRKFSSHGMNELIFLHSRETHSEDNTYVRLMFTAGPCSFSSAMCTFA